MTMKGYRKPEDHTYAHRPQIAALLHAAHGTGDFMGYFMFSLQYVLGLRIGEVIMLRYDHAGPLATDGCPKWVNVPTLKKGEEDHRAERCPHTGKPLYPVPVLSLRNIVAAAFDPKYRAVKSPWLFPAKGGRDATKHLSRSYAIQRFHALQEEACLPDYLSTHALRHSAGTFLYEKSNRRRVVSLFLRHSFGGLGRGDGDGAAVTDRYIHFRVADWQQFAGALDLPPFRATDRL